jgi:2-desacetyl-2-hydroxyethyl bacteriochlorophyllide A dehydrogenase
MPQAIYFTQPDQLALRPITLPALADGDVLIKTAYSCISPGTELRCLAGQQAGAQFPFVPGYSLSGHVVAVGAGVTGLAIGEAVFCTGTASADASLVWGGHVSHAVLPAERVYRLAPGADLLAAACAKMAAIAYHGYRLCPPAAGDQVIVIGLGLIGQLAARCHHLSGARVLGLDLSERRVHLLRAVGREAVTDWEKARAALPDGADLIVDATGASGVIANAIALAREVPWVDSAWAGTRYLVQGSYATDLRLPYQDAFMKQLSFWFTRDAHPVDLRAVLDLIATGQLPVRDLITAVVRPVDAPSVYPRVRTGEWMTAAFDWQLLD